MFASRDRFPVPTTSRGMAARRAFSIQILATAFLMGLSVEVSFDGFEFRTINSHPARAMRAFARFPGSSEREVMEDGLER